MKENYIHIYNNLIELTRNKNLYKDFNNQDIFSDRLTYFLMHFAFFFKVFKSKENKLVLQEIYDFCFKQLELSIREIGYGDQSINKKMKDYINLFHAMIDEFHFWEDLKETDKIEILKKFAINCNNTPLLLDYMEKYLKDLKKNTLNSHLKSVIKR
tara:strand:- start:152 stop:619 length:468 start_codon:yes stop_codon:yes gene_type:complete